MKLAAPLVVALLLLQAAAGIQVVGAQTTTVTPIKHVIMIMMENHSFDNLFGYYPTSNKSTTNPILLSIQKPNDLAGAAIGARLTAIPNGTYDTPNPDEGVYVADWDNGKMDGFAANSGSVSMTYFGASQFGIEWDWAELYAIGDSYYSSCLCMTDPNRLISLAGYAAGMTMDGGPPPYIPYNESIMGELGNYGVSWAYYVNSPAASIFPLNYFEGISGHSNSIQSWNDFYSALDTGSLPAVSWVMPVGGTSPGVDQHPGENITEGEDWLLGVVDRTMRSSVWNSTAIFITYDEGGGFYDHVPPPIVGGQQLGFRIPFIVISPYAKENYVSHTVMNHASQLAFVDYNWRLPALNSFVAQSGLPLDMFDFDQSYPSGTMARPPVVLRNGSTFPVEPQFPLASLPYPRVGAYSGTLASLGTTYFVSSNSSYTPVYESVPFTAAVGIVLLALLVVVGRFARSRRRVPTSL